MELDLYTRPFLSLVFVLGLIFVAAAVIRRFSNRSGVLGKPPAPRLKIVDRLALDSKRHLLVVRHHDHEHVLFLGHNNDFLISSVPPPQHQPAIPPVKEKKQILKAERSAALLATGPLP